MRKGHNSNVSIQISYEVQSVISSFAIISLWKTELIALLLLSSFCHVTVSVLCLFLMVTWVGLQCVIVIVPKHTFTYSIEWKINLRRGTGK